MAEEYCGGANWWDSSAANRSTRFDGGGGGSSSTSSSTTAAYGWLTDASTTVDVNAGRSSLESVPAASSSSFQDTKMDAASLQLVGLGLSSQAMEWNQQHILRNPEKADNSFRSMLQEGMGLNTNFQQDTSGSGVMFGGNSQLQWRPEKLFPSNEDSSEFKQIGRGFSLEQQPQFSPSCSSMESTVTCNQGFQLDSSSSSSVYGSPSSILQGLMGSDQQNQQQQQLNYAGANNSNNYQQNYFGIAASNNQHQWAKVPQFLRPSSPKQQQQQQQLQFINNAPYWNASAPAVSMTDVRPNFFSSLQAPQLSMPTFEEKPKLQSTMETRDTNSMAKKSGQEANTKRARNDAASSTLPPFKVRKEKMGDRITALQQLVSPFGKTDTASVLSEAIEYIKFLHEQVSVLSNPYLKSGAPYQQHQQSNDKAKIDPDGPKQDLRSRGLCLVPVSSTFPVTHETTVDFWTPTFGGTFR